MLGPTHAQTRLWLPWLRWVVGRLGLMLGRLTGGRRHVGLVVIGWLLPLAIGAGRSCEARQRERDEALATGEDRRAIVISRRCAFVFVVPLGHRFSLPGPGVGR